MIGVQMFGLAKSLDRGLENVLKELSDIGVEDIEPFVLFSENGYDKKPSIWGYKTLKEALPLFEKYNIALKSCHIGIGFKEFLMPTKKIIEGIKTINEISGIKYYVVSGMFSNERVAKKYAKVMLKVENEISKYGCHMIYHNHKEEFTKLKDGSYAIDTFLKESNYQIKLELDIGWASFRINEKEAFEKYGKYVEFLHFKDFYESAKAKNGVNPKAEDFAPILEGVVDTKTAINMYLANKENQQLMIIDQDDYAGEMLDAVRIGYNNIKGCL